jgi:hypothetical protein
MKLKADFINDWHDHLRNEIQNKYNYDVSYLENDRMPLVYFNIIKRIIKRKPRNVVESDAFKCPEHKLNGWCQLKTDIESGKDINHYLSTTIKKAEYLDKLLNY